MATSFAIPTQKDNSPHLPALPPFARQPQPATTQAALPGGCHSSAEKTKRGGGRLIIHATLEALARRANKPKKANKLESTPFDFDVPPQQISIPWTRGDRLGPPLGGALVVLPPSRGAIRQYSENTGFVFILYLIDT